MALTRINGIGTVWRLLTTEVAKRLSVQNISFLSKTLKSRVYLRVRFRISGWKSSLIYLHFVPVSFASGESRTITSWMLETTQAMQVRLFSFLQGFVHLIDLMWNWLFSTPLIEGAFCVYDKRPHCRFETWHSLFLFAFLLFLSIEDGNASQMIDTCKSWSLWKCNQRYKTILCKYVSALNGKLNFFGQKHWIFV